MVGHLARAINRTLQVALLWPWWGFTIGCSTAAEFHVAPTAAPQGDGSKSAPFGSLEQARDAVRRWRLEHPAESITVWLEGGIYRRNQSLLLGPADSGTAAAPICWQAVEPGKAVLSLGRVIAPHRWAQVTSPATMARLDPKAQGHVYELDLAANALHHGKAFPVRFDHVAGLVRLFFDGVAQPLSRWPNGPRGYTTFERVLDSGDLRANQPHGGTFRYAGDRPRRWLPALANDGVWLRGFWRVPWEIEALRVKSIDPAARTITFAVSTPNGIGSKYTPAVNGTRPGGGVENWYALNLVEEIEQPGEWAVDFYKGKLYFWPPAPLEGHELVIADEQAPIIALQDAAHIELRQLTVLQSLGSGIEIRGGEAVTLAGCTVRDVDECGVRVLGGFHHRVESCDVFFTGQHGIDLTGGKRATLTPGGHEIVNNHIHHIGLAGPFPALRAGEATRAEVVGNRVAHNRIHDCPNAGVRYAGNNNVFEFNEVYRVGLDSSDLGAFYTNSGWTSRGNVLRHNFVHHSQNAQGFYLDDGDCGDVVEENLVYKVQSGVFIGGGSDHVVRRNIFVACDRAIHIDARGRARHYTLEDRRLATDLASVPYRQPPWRETYPQLVGFPARDTTLPTDVLIEDNLAVGCATAIRKSATTAELAGVHFGPLSEAPLTLFQNPAGLDFTVVDSRQQGGLPLGLPAIALDRIGLQPGPPRPVLPNRDLHQLQTEPTVRQRFDSQKDLDASNQR